MNGDTALRIGAPLFAAGLLSTLTLRTLRRRRQRQLQHRPIGRRLPEPASPITETHMRVVAEPAAVDRLDHALRALAAQLAGRPAEQVPDIVGAWLTGDTVNLLLTTANPDAPPPWTSHERTWVLPADADLPDADGELAPLPTLVAVGSQPGTHLLIDLERLGLLGITGDATTRGNLMRYLAAELALNTWSDHVDIHLAGFSPEETSDLLALNSQRTDAAPSVPAAIQRIRRRAGQVVQSLDHLGAGDTLTGRINDIAADAWMPHILLLNNPSDDDLAALSTLDDDLAQIGRCAVAVVVSSSEPVGRWPITVDTDTNLRIDFLDMSEQSNLTAAQLPPTELHALSDLLATARRGVPTTDLTDASDQGDTWPSVPPAPEPEQWARGTDAGGALLPDQRADIDADETDPTDDEAPAPILGDEHGDSGAPEPADPPEPRDKPEPDQEAPHEDPAPAPAPTVSVPVTPQASRKRITSQVRAHRDPTLDTDLRAWIEHDPNRPRIAILGPVTVEAPGQMPDERLRFFAEIITLLAVRGRRGVTTDQLDEAIWPGQQVKPNTRRVAIMRARRWLGDTPDGEAWLPDATTDRRYRLRDGYLVDWTLFRRLRARGESRGPAGIADLRHALGHVRGTPLAGADIAYNSISRNPFVWLPTSEIQPHHLAAAVVDTAHRLVELCLDGGDIPGARWAVDQAWLADPDRANDVAWRDLINVAAAENNTAELDHLLQELMTIRNAEVPEDLDIETYRLLCDVMPTKMRAGVR